LCFASDTTGDLFASTHPARGLSAWWVAQVGTGVVTGLSCPSTARCFAIDSSGHVLAGGPPPTTREVRALLLERLVPAGKHATITNVLKNGGYAFFFTAPSAGRLSISWNLKAVPIAAAKTRFTNGGRIKVRIALTRRGRRLLAAVRHVQLTAKATFRPTGRSGITGHKAFALNR
jgi:hypothetical protein